MIDRSGQRLGNYHLTALLGRGGFAEVYLGEHIYLKTQVAVKVLQTHLSNPQDQQDFLREAQLVARLVHPHIVRVLDFDVEGEIPYLVMDYASEGTLRKLHPRGTLVSLATVVSYVQQVAEALQYSHDQKLIHRDVKPENMLVSKDKEILLSDFGIALVLQSSRSQSTQSVTGTVAYMSPEQIQGQPGRQSDQYSLAIVTYEWLSGQLPFRGSFAELCTQHLFAPIPSLRTKVPTIAPEVEQVLLTALAKDPKERFTTVQAFATALKQAGKNGQVALHPANLPLSAGPHPPATSVYGAANTTATQASAPPPEQPSVVAAHRDTPPAQVMTPLRSPTPPLSASVGSIAPWVSRRALLRAGGIGLGAVALGGALFGLISQASHSGSYFATPTPSLPRNLIFLYQGHATTSLSGEEIHLCWSPDGTRIMSTDGKTVQVWDAFNGKHASTYHLLNSSSNIGHDFDMAWTTNGPCVAQADNGTRLIHVLNATTGQDIAVYNGHEIASESIASDGSGIIAWSPDGTRIASIGENNMVSLTPTTRVWNVTSGQGISSFTPSVPTGQFASIKTIAWSPDSARIALPGDNGMVYVWDPGNGQQTIAFSKHTADLYTVNQSTKMTVIDLAWAPNSQQIVSAASSDGGDEIHMVRVWDVKSGNQIFAKGSQLAHISWSPQAPLIAVDVADSNSTVQIWNASNGQVLSTQHYNYFAWSPDGKRIASDLERGPGKSGYEALNVWDATSGARLVSYSDPSDVSSDIASLTWSPDGKYIATASEYGTIAIWRV